ncbi:MAG: histidine kinase dimerization/phospho-acceptor domain-containing protein, partial [Gammaproteobacteria bacterium]
MPIKRPKSLKNLLLIHEIAFLFLVAVTGLLGGISAYFWQHNSAESVRLNNLIFTTEQIRSELHAQINEVFFARLLEDQRAVLDYGEYSRNIDKRFNSLRSNSVFHEEDKAIQELQKTYREMQSDMNKIFKDPYMISHNVQVNILNPRIKQEMLQAFDNKYLAVKSLLFDEHKALDITLERWTRYAPVIIPIPLVLAIILVLFARNTLSKGFIQPLSHVIEGAKIFSRGQLKHNIPAKGVEEVSDLAQAINGMARDLETSRNALVESEKQAALGALVPVVAHNIRNPLASIRATAQVLDDVEDAEELKECRQAILDTIDRLGRWVNALVSYLHPLKPNYRL